MSKLFIRSAPVPFGHSLAKNAPLNFIKDEGGDRLNKCILHFKFKHNNRLMDGTVSLRYKEFIEEGWKTAKKQGSACQVLPFLDAAAVIPDVPSPRLVNTGMTRPDCSRPDCIHC